MTLDPALKAQLKTLSTDTRAMRQRGLNVASEYSAVQQAGFALDGNCHDAYDSAKDGMLDDYDTDSSGCGKGALAGLGLVTTGQPAIVTQGTAANTDRTGWNNDLTTLQARYATLLGSVAAGPIKLAIARSSDYLTSALTSGQALNFNPSQDSDRFQVALANATGYASTVAADKGPDSHGKGGKLVAAPARAACEAITEIKTLLARVTNQAYLTGVGQESAANLCTRAAESIEQVTRLS